MKSLAGWFDQLRPSLPETLAQDIEYIGQELLADLKSARETMAQMPSFGRVDSVFSFLPTLQVHTSTLAKTAREAQKLLGIAGRRLAADDQEPASTRTDAERSDSWIILPKHPVVIPAKYFTFKAAVYSLLETADAVEIVLSLEIPGPSVPSLAEYLLLVASKLSLLESASLHLSREAGSLHRALMTRRESRDQLDAALTRDYQAHLRQHPDDRHAWLDLAEAMLDRDNLPGAEDAIRHAMDLEPNSSRALHLAAMLARKRGHIDESIDLLQRALEAFPDFALAWAELARAYTQSGNQRMAMTAAAHAVKLEPGNVGMRRLLERLLKL